VSVEKQGWGISLAGQARYQVGSGRGFGKQPGLDAGLGQQLVDECDAFPFVARRVGGIKLDQPLQDLDRIVTGGRNDTFFVH